MLGALISRQAERRTPPSKAGENLLGTAIPLDHRCRDEPSNVYQAVTRDVRSEPVSRGT